MAHDCIEWTTTPLSRKLPLLILTYGNDRVYTAVPKELKILEEVARREFNLADAEIRFSSSCLNLCNGLPARITESAWEHMSPYIGCAVVEASEPRAVPPQGKTDLLQDVGLSSHTSGTPPKEQPTASENTRDKQDLSIGQGLQPDLDAGNESKPPDQGLDGAPNSLTREAVWDEQNATSQRRNDHGGAAVPDDRYEDAWEEEVSAVPPRRSRNRYRVVSDDEDAGEDPAPKYEIPANPPSPTVASPSKPTQPRKGVTKERDGGSHSHAESQAAELVHSHTKPIKWEKRESESDGGRRPYSNDDGHSQPLHTETRQETQPQAPVESSGNQRIMIRVAHRPSKQESKFTTKGTTKVAKVLAGACKSFGLDAGRATLYLIVSTDDEDGEMESLFPCDKNDTIARAGAEHDTESRFLLKMVGEA